MLRAVERFKKPSAFHEQLPSKQINWTTKIIKMLSRLASSVNHRLLPKSLGVSQVNDKWNKLISS